MLETFKALLLFQGPLQELEGGALDIFVDQALLLRCGLTWVTVNDVLPVMVAGGTVVRFNIGSKRARCKGGGRQSFESILWYLIQDKRMCATCSVPFVLVQHHLQGCRVGQVCLCLGAGPVRLLFIKINPECNWMDKIFMFLLFKKGLILSLSN